MKLLFKQRFFSWFDSYDIFDETGNVVFTVKGQLSWGHKLNIYDAKGAYIATVKEVVFTFMPKFEFHVGGNCLGCMKKHFTFFRQNYSLFNGWHVDGNFMAWDYVISSPGGVVARVSKQIFNWTDTYVIDVVNPSDTLLCLMFTLAIDAEKCSQNN